MFSFSKAIEKEISELKARNSSFNNGFVRGYDDGTVLDFLSKDKRIENAYYKCKLENLELKLGRRANG